MYIAGTPIRLRVPRAVKVSKRGITLGDSYYFTAQATAAAGYAHMCVVVVYFVDSYHENPMSVCIYYVY